MKLIRLKCLKCQKDFFIYEDDKNSIIIANEGIYLYAVCPFGCNKDDKQSDSILELGEIEFDDQFKLSMKKIDKIKDQIESVLHEIENLNTGIDEAYLQKGMQLKKDLEANKNES